MEDLSTSLRPEKNDADDLLPEYSRTSSSSSIIMLPSHQKGSSSSSSSSMVMTSDDDHDSTTSRIQEPKSKKLRKKSLGLDFQPGEYAVVCGRGKEYSLSTGNCFLRSLVNHCLVRYANASTKAEKSQIVTAIIQSVHAIPTGIFVRFEKSQWWEVDDAFARDKIGSLFRDSLFTKYRSSTKAKMEKKRIKNIHEASGIKPCVGSVPDLLDDDYDEISLVMPTIGSPCLQNSQEQQVISASLKDQSSLGPPLCNLICDDGSSVATLSPNSLCFSQEKHSQSDEAFFSSQLPPPSCRLFPPRLRRQEDLIKVKRQVSDSSLTDNTPSCVGDQQYTEQISLPFQNNQWITCQENETTLDTMISDIDELDSFLQNCF